MFAMNVRLRLSHQPLSFYYFSNIIQSWGCSFCMMLQLWVYASAHDSITVLTEKNSSGWRIDGSDWLSSITCWLQGSLCLGKEWQWVVEGGSGLCLSLCLSAALAVWGGWDYVTKKCRIVLGCLSKQTIRDWVQAVPESKKQLIETWRSSTTGQEDPFLLGRWNMEGVSLKLCDSSCKYFCLRILERTK